MALDFPDSPSPGDIFDDQWIWDGSKWIGTGGSVGPPGPPGPAGPPGPGAAPAGANGSVQFNNNGAYGGDDGFTYAAGVLDVADITSSSIDGLTLQSTGAEGGISFLQIINTQGVNGAQFSTVGSPNNLVDLVFQTNPADWPSQSNIRYETRPGSITWGSGNTTEFQIGVPNDISMALGDVHNFSVKPLLLNADPTQPMGAVTKQYVDAITPASAPAPGAWTNLDVIGTNWNQPYRVQARRWADGAMASIRGQISLNINAGIPVGQALDVCAIGAVPSNYRPPSSVTLPLAGIVPNNVVYVFIGSNGTINITAVGADIPFGTIVYLYAHWALT